MTNYDFLIIGGGIFGLSTAVELAQRQYRVGLLNPDTIPHHLAASTDVTKAVRMEYGADQEYFRMAEICIERWRTWNEFFGETLYHEVGFLMLGQQSLEDERQAFERDSYETLRAGGYPIEQLDVDTLRRRFPAINAAAYPTAIFNPVAGYVNSARVIEKLAQYARSLGVRIHEQQTASELMVERGRFLGVRTQEGGHFPCGHAILAAGAHTPYLLPELQPYMLVTGHPVFWLKPLDPSQLAAPLLSFFTADISNTGWYGFPYLPEQGIIKVARHSAGLEIHPDRDDRRVTDAEVADLRTFLRLTLSQLVDAPIVYTRRCLYTDTLDGHYWIDQHPEIEGLTVSTGGSGHAMKMGPLLGEMTAATALGESHEFSARYRWRELNREQRVGEQARHLG